MPAIGASTTGVGTVSGPRVSAGMRRLSAAPGRAAKLDVSLLGRLLCFFACVTFETGPVQVIASKSWVGRKLIAVSVPWPGAK